MADDPQHAEVERVIVEALARFSDERERFDAGSSVCWRAKAVMAALRAALRDHRLTPDQVGAAVGLRAEVTPSGVCVSRGRCLCTPCLAVAPEDGGDMTAAASRPWTAPDCRVVTAYAEPRQRAEAAETFARAAERAALYAL